MLAIFDITDGRNRYEPCPQCGAATGMGLVSTAGTLHVQCGCCGHRGPAVQCPPAGQWTSWPVPWHERDKQAFDGWNNEARAATTAGAGA